MATAQQGPTPEFAAGLRQIMLDGMLRELETTKKVIAAIPDGKSDYRPDPNSRTAAELAWHLATADIQFFDGIADLKFAMEDTAEANRPKTIGEILDWYQKNFTRAAARVAPCRERARRRQAPRSERSCRTWPGVPYRGRAAPVATGR